MIGFALRAVATVLLAAACVSGVLDITRSIAAAGFVATPLGASWTAVLPDLLADVEARVAPIAWAKSAFDLLLSVPTWLVLGALALVLFWIGRPRTRIGSRFSYE